jgi:hypothetical protein
MRFGVSSLPLFASINTGMERRWAAPWRSRLFVTLGWGLTAAAACVLIVAAVFVGGPVAIRILVAVAMLPVAVLAVRITVRAQKALVTVGPDGVEIVGLLRSRRVPLAEVDRFEVSTFKTSCVFLVPVTGRGYMLWVTSRGIAAVATDRTRARLETLCAEMNAALVDGRLS